MKNPLILIGFPTVGKSTIGHEISKQHNLNFIDLDIQFEKIYGLSPRDYIYVFGFDEYRIKEFFLLQETLELPYEIIATGGGIVEYQQSRNLLLGQENVIFLTKPREMLKRDILKRFPRLYKESFTELYDRRLPFLKLCGNYEFYVGNLSISETIKNFNVKFNHILFPQLHSVWR